MSRWEELLSTGKERIKLGNPPVEIHKPQQVTVRQEGFWQKPNPVDKAHARRIDELYYKGKEQGYGFEVVTALGEATRFVATSAVERMEELNQELPPESLARELGEKLTGLNAQIFAELQISLIKDYGQHIITSTKRSP